MKKIVFISDLFATDILGGGELNNKVLIEMLTQRGYKVEKIHSHKVTENVLNENNFFIISNFLNLNRQLFKILKNKKYIIYEHDHKYIKSRNPATYGKTLKAPPSEIINYKFYKNSIAILCQSKLHKTIIEKNLELTNVINLGGNLWSEETLDVIEKLSKNNKKTSCAIMDSPIPHKNTKAAIEYCNRNNLNFKLCKSNSYHDFLQQLSENSHFVFFPLTPETLSRIVVEARMLGCSVTTTKIVGATSEDWFKLKGIELIDFLRDKKKQIVDIVEKLYETEIKTGIKKKPDVSIITTFIEGGKYLEHFMDNITSQTIFDQCELIIVDANSNGSEQKLINQYQKRFKNIIYHRINEKLKPTPCLNKAIKIASGEYITFAFIDDIKADDCIEVLLKSIKKSFNIDLVYGDVIVVDKINQKFNKHKNSNNIFEHSQYEFSLENMVKCLPGPMPLWKSSMHEKNGFFDTVRCDYADDWEMWLRAVSTGSKFKKVNKKVGLYCSNGRSAQRNNKKQRIEEAKIFFAYSHIFGNNYTKYKPYFNQFLEIQ